ncbi:MAG: hypothetical protein C0501_17515 [Isosphaera sp.]|nr:hypothetical protein [Isosphaera sp.]
MTRFADAAGDEWGILFTLDTARRLRDDAGFDPDQLDASPGPAADALTADPAVVARVLWVLCEDEAAARGVGPADFARRLAGPALDRAVDAFLEELVLFGHRAPAGRALAARLRGALAGAGSGAESTPAGG